MQCYSNTAFAAAVDGSAVATGGVTFLAGATVTVRNSAGGIAPLFSDDSGTTKANPFTTAADGEYSFFAANGIYSIEVAKTGYVTDTKTGVALFDPDDLIVSVKGSPFNATGNPSIDDTAAIQAAADYAMAIRGELFFPANDAGGYYKTTAPIVFDSALHIRGEGPNAVTIFGSGLSAGAYVFDFNCIALDVIEQVTISGLTLRSNDGVPNALRFKNVSYVLVKDSVVYNVANGVDIEGTRCFSHTYEQLNSVSVGVSTVRFAAGFNGGGQYVFNGCTLSGDIGCYVPATAVLDNLAFAGTNFEQCVTNSLSISGTVAGLSVAGCRTEGCNGVDFRLRPFGAAEYIGGMSITGTVFGSGDAGSANRVDIGGDSGKVRGFNICGNVVTHGTDSFTGALVNLNGEGESGLVSGNYLRGTTCVAVNGQRAGVVVFGNENMAGKLDEWWGTGRSAAGSFTATATGMTTAPTGTVKYRVVGGMATLDIPAISGTSNATTFTLTGAPSAVTPAADKDVLCLVQDNSGSVTSGLLRVKTTGILELYAAVAGTAFTAAGTKSVGAVSVSYTLF